MLSVLNFANSTNQKNFNMSPVPANPDFRSRAFLSQHSRDIFNFYHPRAIDTQGGFFQHFRDDGSIYDADTRHLVSSTRFVFNYSVWAQLLADDGLKAQVQHGFNFLRECHLQDKTGGYAWLLKSGAVEDGTNHCYGLAFVMLACSWAHRAGVSGAKLQLASTFDLMEQHFWDAEAGLYKDEISADWQQVSDYRGQNANMHSCEALLTAFEATSEARYLERAQLLASNMCQRQAALGDGLIWEHYDTAWQIDWDYNRDDPKHLFRPWGFQPGHQTEWAKLLLILNEYAPQVWLVEKAKELFDRALASAWDEEHGGICYGFAPDGSVCDGDKYFWVQAESFAAAARLAKATGDEKYWQWYERIWQYCWNHMIDHEYGAWFRILTRENQKIDDLKSPAGKTDYHTLGACFDVLVSGADLRD